MPCAWSSLLYNCRVLAQTFFAKITRPRLPAMVLRERLFRLLDRGRSVPLIWVSGPGGSGKTTLVASWLDARELPCLWYHLDAGDNDIATFFYYLGRAAKIAAPRHKTPLPLLTAEYMQGIPAFTKRYFETLCSRLKTPSAIVFDNYHHLAPGAPLHEVIRDALPVIPDGVTVVINSRGAPPSSLALFKAYNRIHRIGWDELKFDRDETGVLLRSGCRQEMNDAAVDQLQRVTTGWAAGLVLLMERLRTGESVPLGLERLNSEDLFDYFAAEFFEKTAPEMQTFLLKTAFLTIISPQGALAMTARDDAEALLSGLSRNHFFTEQRSVSNPLYQYHPLFRAFLKARARQTFARDELREIMRKAAGLLAGMGQVEDAAALYRTSGEWEGLVGLILAQAGPMVAQGRNRPLEEWLQAIPAEILAGDPWLLYWLGVCTMPYRLLEGRGYFEKALALFRQRRDTEGAFLSWAGAVEAIVQEMGDIRRLKSWVALFNELVKEFGNPPPAIEAQVTFRIFAALPWRRDDPTFAFWDDKALALVESDEDPGLRMLTGFYLFSYHAWWRGDYATGRRVLDRMARTAKAHSHLPPLVLTLLKPSEALSALLTGTHEHCLNAVSEGLEIAEASGVSLWNNVLLMAGSGSCLCAGDLARAGKFLDRMAVSLDGARPFDRFYYYHIWLLMKLSQSYRNMRKTGVE